MVEINNQRKAFLDMLAWSEGTDNGRQKTRNHGYDVIVGGELFTDYSDHPRKLVTLNPKLKSTGAGRYQLLSVGGMPTASSLAWKTSLRKSQDAVALQQIKERGALPMIDRGDIRQAIDRCSNIWASLPGAGYGQFERQADSLIAKFEAERSEDWCMSRVTAIISALVICIIVCLSWAVNHYRDNAITYKAQQTKMPENWSWRTRRTTLPGCVSVMLLRRCKIPGELADAKAQMMLCVMMLPLVVVSFVKAVCQSVREATTASGVDVTTSWLADTAERDYFTLRERLITIQKQLEGTEVY